MLFVYCVFWKTDGALMCEVFKNKEAAVKFADNISSAYVVEKALRNDDF